MHTLAHISNKGRASPVPDALAAQRSTRAVDIFILTSSVVALAMLSMMYVQVELAVNHQAGQVRCICEKATCEPEVASAPPPLLSERALPKMTTVPTTSTTSATSTAAFTIMDSVPPLPPRYEVPTSRPEAISYYYSGGRRGHGRFRQPVVYVTPPPLISVTDAADTVKIHNVGNTQHMPLAGPLCVFVPANGHDSNHQSEILAFLEAWGDNSTILYSENDEILRMSKLAATEHGVTLVKANHATWNGFHQGTVLSKTSLVNRGATAHNIRGRGQLSIPLFHWISQLVKRDDPLVQNCKWFMKCDTDTYLRRGLLEREVLNKLDHTKPYHVGVPLKFNTRPYHHTLRTIEFEYNIGGPGYSFSRGLMATVDMKECLPSMATDPVLLIHDDVATGFCATYYSPGSQLVRIHTAISSSASGVVSRLVGPQVSAMPPRNLSSCVHRVTSAHPVNATLMKILGNINRGQVTTDSASGCEATLMAGVTPTIGADWTKALAADPDFELTVSYWRCFFDDAIRATVTARRYAEYAKAQRFQEMLFRKDD